MTGATTTPVTAGSPMKQLVRDQFGNCVVQRVLDASVQLFFFLKKRFTETDGIRSKA